jgi:hypothetical protein
MSGWTDTVRNAIFAWVQGSSGLAADSVQWKNQRAPRPAPPSLELHLSGEADTGPDGVDTRRKLLAFADLTITSVAGDQLRAVAHGKVTGDGPVRITSTGAVPAGSSAAVDYYLIVVDADHLELALTVGNAHVGAQVVLSSSGSGTIKLVATAKTARSGHEVEYIARGLRSATLELQSFAVDATSTGAAGAILSRVKASVRLPSNQDALRAAKVGVLSFSPVHEIGGTVINQAVFEPRAVLEVQLCVTSEVAEDGTFIEFVEVTDSSTGRVLQIPSDPLP